MGPVVRVKARRATHLGRSHPVFQFFTSFLLLFFFLSCSGGGRVMDNLTYGDRSMRNQATGDSMFTPTKTESTSALGDSDIKVYFKLSTESVALQEVIP